MNYELFKWINQQAGSHPAFDAAMVFVTEKSMLIYPIVLILMWIFGKQRLKQAVVFAAVTGALALAVNYIIGYIHFVQRPFVAHDVNLLVAHDNSFSFPSNHTTGAFALSIAILFYFRRFGLLMLGFAFLTGFSRIYVGHHYPADVLGSIVISVLTAWGVFKMKKGVAVLSTGLIRLYDRILSFLPLGSRQN